MTRIWVCIISILSLAALAERTAKASVALPPTPPSIDGKFTTTDEWTGAGVSSSNFALTAHAGGATLYSQVIGNTIYFMFDYYTHPPVDGFSSRFDVFFTSPNGLKDYLVQIYQGSNIGGANIQTYEKDADAAVEDNPFVVTDGVWQPMDSSVKTAGDFVGKINIGASPDNPTTHVMAEFEMSVDSSGNPSGVFGQSGTFLSVSELDYTPFVVYDPPIISGVIDINGGLPSLAPVLDANGDPVPQPQEGAVAPEAASWLIWTLPMIGLAIFGGIRSFRRRAILAA
jgi:hypothetical protein